MGTDNKKEDKYSYVRILSGQIPKDVPKKKLLIELPEELLRDLDEILKVLPVGYKSSKVRVIYSLLSQFVEDQREDIMEYFDAMKGLKKKKEEE